MMPTSGPSTTTLPDPAARRLPIGATASPQLPPQLLSPLQAVRRADRPAAADLFRARSELLRRNPHRPDFRGAPAAADHYTHWLLGAEPAQHTSHLAFLQDVEAFCKIFDLCPTYFEVNADISHYNYRAITKGDPSPPSPHPPAH